MSSFLDSGSLFPNYADKLMTERENTEMKCQYRSDMERAQALLDAFVSRTPELTDTKVIEFCDDGWSGTNFECPAVREMLTQMREGKIQCIIVKDLSRFGRNYLEVGNYISHVFPFLGVRLIAVNDGFDSIRPTDIDSLEISFKNLLYDLYSRNLSRKVRNAKKFRAQRGDYLSPFAPYGYIKDPADKTHLLIDAGRKNICIAVLHCSIPHISVQSECR